MYYNYSDLNYINQELNGVWPGWFAVRLLGRGAFGAVYEIQRNVRGNLEKAAMKVLRVPDSDAEVARIQFQGMTWQNTEEYYEKYVDGIHNEIRIMQSFVGNSHIVSYEDYSIRKRYNQIGWDLYIRMELLAGLPDYMKTHSFDEKMTVRLGMDIAQGLRDCHNAGIIHRDVKPENIFVNKVGNFKLGDFGISRNAPGSHDVLSFKGTLAYMAPEVYRMLSTDARSDIYSLGMVLYQCLNDNRLPFVPSKFSPFDIETARQRRFAGEPIPAPAHGSRALKNIVLRALEERPEDRFQTAEDLYFELMEVYRADYGTGRRSAGSAGRVGRNEYSRDYNYDKSAERKAEYGARETVLLEEAAPVENSWEEVEEPAVEKSRVEEKAQVESNLKEEVELPVESSLEEAEEPPVVSSWEEEEEPLAENNVKEVVEPSAEVTCEEEPEEVSKAASDGNAKQVEKRIPPQQEQEKIFHDHEVIEKEFTGQAAAETMHEYRKLAVLIIGIVLFLFATRMYFSSQNEDYAIEWNDAALEAKMHEITGISTGDNIMYSDVERITALDLYNPNGTSYDNDKIKDISALSSLKNLKHLNLRNNSISDISAIGNLTNLTELILGSNQISNISAIGSLTNLTCLMLNDNRIKDISALRNLTKLKSMSLDSNQISDISPLSNLTNLHLLNIRNNPINDYSPIKDLNIVILYK